MVVLQRAQKKVTCFLFVYLASFSNAYACSGAWNQLECEDVVFHFENYTNLNISSTSDGYGFYKYYPTTFLLPAASGNNPGTAQTGGGYYRTGFDEDDHTGDDHFSFSENGASIFQFLVSNKNNQQFKYTISQSNNTDGYVGYLYDTDNATPRFLFSQNASTAKTGYWDHPSGTTNFYFHVYSKIKNISVINFTNKILDSEIVPGDSLSSYNISEPERANQVLPIPTKKIIPKHFYQLTDITLYHPQKLVFSIENSDQTTVECPVPFDQNSRPLQNFSWSFNYNGTNGQIECKSYTNFPKGFYQINSKGVYLDDINYNPTQSDAFLYSDGEKACSLNSTENFVKVYENLGGGKNNSGGFDFGNDVLNLDLIGDFAKSIVISNCNISILKNLNILNQKEMAHNPFLATPNGEMNDGVYLHISQEKNIQELIYVKNNSYFLVPTIDILYSLVQSGTAGDDSAIYYNIQNYSVMPEFLLKKLQNKGVCQAYNGECKSN